MCCQAQQRAIFIRDSVTYEDPRINRNTDLVVVAAVLLVKLEWDPLNT